MGWRHLITEAGTVLTEVVIDRGIAADAGLIAPPGEGRQRVAVLTQPGPHRWGAATAAAIARTGAQVEVVTLPDGEVAKTLSVVEGAYRELNRLGLTRHDLVVGVGGGALTDVAGFVAGTYLRGVDVVLVPTTLLGAVDASIGGKTAVNVDGKNLAGLFHHPVRVLVDLDILDRIPLDLIRQGAAEALKAGLIGDPELVAVYERHGLDAPLDQVVERAIAVKAALVSADPTEQDRRAWLNYGHTVGHAVEVAAGIGHGEAVAVGMVAAGAASEVETGFGEAERVIHLLGLLGLPVTVSGLDPDEVRRLIALDKKRDRSGLRMTLLRAIGDPIVTPVGAATVNAALAAIGVG